MQTPEEKSKEIQRLVNEIINGLAQVVEDENIKIPVSRKFQLNQHIQSMVTKGMEIAVSSNPGLTFYVPAMVTLKIVENEDPQAEYKWEVYANLSVSLETLHSLLLGSIIDRLEQILKWVEGFRVPEPELFKVVAGTLKNGIPKRILLEGWTQWKKSIEPPSDHDGDGFTILANEYREGAKEMAKRLFPELKPEEVQFHFGKVIVGEGIEVMFHKVIKTQI